MKKKLVSVFLALCLIVVLMPTGALADGDYIFTAANDTLLPLDTSSMPVYTNGSLYIPYTVFVSNGFGVYSAWFNGGTTLCLYDSSSTLFFDMEKGNSYSESNTSFNIGAEYINGTLYVPAYFVSGLFKLTCSVLSSASASIVRICSGTQSYANSSFAALCEPDIRAAIEALNPPTPPTPPTPPDPENDPEEDEDHSNVTLLLAFRDISAGECAGVLDTLDSRNMRACFFVTAAEIRENADLIRRIAGSGHSIGIYLEQGTLEEFEEARSLLFEAAMITTCLVSSANAVREGAKTLCAENGLFYREADVSENDAFSIGYLQDTLSVTPGARQIFLFRCRNGADTLLADFIWTIRKENYTVRRMTDVYPV